MIKIHGIQPLTADHAARLRYRAGKAHVAPVKTAVAVARGAVDARNVAAERQRQQDLLTPPAYMLASLIERMGGALTSASKGSFIRLSV